MSKCLKSKISLEGVTSQHKCNLILSERPGTFVQVTAVFVEETSSFVIVTEHVPAGA